MTSWILMMVSFGIPPGAPIDRVVAVVDREIITESELLIESRIALALREGEQAAVMNLPDEAMVVFCDYVINQTLLSFQVRRLGGQDDADTSRQMSFFRQQFHSEASFRSFLRRFNISMDILQKILRRDLLNQKFIKQRFRYYGMGQQANEETDTKLLTEQTKSFIDELAKQYEIRILNQDGELVRRQ